MKEGADIRGSATESYAIGLEEVNLQIWKRAM